AYNVAFASVVEGPLDAGLFREALQIIVDRHETLRTTYALRGDDPIRVIAGSVPVPVRHVDAPGWSAGERKDAIDADYAAPFNLESGPVVRAALSRQSSDRNVLLLVIHHIAIDGTSLFVLLEELFDVYAALAAGSGIPA